MNTEGPHYGIEALAHNDAANSQAWRNTQMLHRIIRIAIFAAFIGAALSLL